MSCSCRTRPIDSRRDATSRELSHEHMREQPGAEFTAPTPASPGSSAELEQPQSSGRTTGLDLRATHILRLAAALLGSLRTAITSLASSASPVSRGMRRLQGRDRRLQVTETVQLGEKRFVALVRVDGEQFLIGGGTAGVSLLATLPPAPVATLAEPVQVVSSAAEPATPASFPELLTAARLRGELA